MTTRSYRARNAAYARWHKTPEPTVEQSKKLDEKYERVAIENAQPGGVTMKFTRKVVK